MPCQLVYGLLVFFGSSPSHRKSDQVIVIRFSFSFPPVGEPHPATKNMFVTVTATKTGPSRPIGGLGPMTHD